MVTHEVIDEEISREKRSHGVDLDKRVNERWNGLMEVSLSGWVELVSVC